jgi:hypothetical protein
MKLHKLQPKGEHVYCSQPGCTFRQSLRWVDIPSWHKKPCPTCGKGEIVTDKDLSTWRLLDAVIGMTADAPPIPDGAEGVVTVRIDTGPGHGAKDKE